MTRRTIGDNFASPQHKVHAWHFFKLPFSSEKCFHNKNEADTHCIQQEGVLKGIKI